ncbi:conserved hypothetical protein [Culex quinquefasciatus]|uniref:MD-2-related lipid-recognition domain-containing protein n=1 Tax=Culex quinquefasciatus TaxID=7176 RepID=B0XE80_CULQU|nr:conserved hypothetical protein [Culex quinquefasciatus]|eukprot:XP_001867952.1 conserved hypothetical protein [Culex quinquefasciatus]
MKFATFLTLVVTVPSAIVLAEYVLDIVDYQQDCENGMPKFGMDMSDLDTNLDEEGNPTATGKIVFTEEYNDPISVHAYTKRFLHGSWEDGEISRDVTNLCSLLTVPVEPWYPFFSAMKNQGCPFEKGVCYRKKHEEYLENVALGDVPINFPSTFAGEWRMYLEINTSRGGQSVTECMRIAFDIKEV